MFTGAGANETILAGVGKPAHFDVLEFKVLAGVHDAYRISAPYKLAGRSFRPEGTKIAFSNGVVVGGEEVVVMAGPCSVGSARATPPSTVPPSPPPLRRQPPRHC